MHLKRWITAIIALPLLILLISKGGAFLFAAFICLVSIISMAEYFRIVLINPGMIQKGLSLYSGYSSGLELFSLLI